MTPTQLTVLISLLGLLVSTLIGLIAWIDGDIQYLQANNTVTVVQV